MEKISVIDSTDNLIDSVDNSNNSKVNSIDNSNNSQPNTQPMKKKQVRKPLTEEAKMKKRDILAKARDAKNNKVKDKIQVDFNFKQKVETLENLETIIDRKLTEKKAKKEPKNKVDKAEQKKKMIDDLVESKLASVLKGYKQAKQPESDFKLIQQFF